MTFGARENVRKSARRTAPTHTTTTIMLARRVLLTTSRFHAAKSLIAQPSIARRALSTPPKEVTIYFMEKGKKIEVQAKVGQTVLDVAKDFDIDMEGACEGSLACSTCHVILEEGLYNKLAEPTDEENDMLDLAFGLTDTSRLGCQIVIKPELEGSVFTLPAATRNMMPDKQ